MINFLQVPLIDVLIVPSLFWTIGKCSFDQFSGMIFTFCPSKLLKPSDGQVLRVKDDPRTKSIEQCMRQLCQGHRNHDFSEAVCSTRMTEVIERMNSLGLHHRTITNCFDGLSQTVYRI